MNLAALWATYGAYAVTAAVAAVAGYMFRGSSSTPAAPVHPLVADPVVQAVLNKFVTAAHVSGHAALDAVATKLFPGLVPLLPTINTVIDNAESKLVPASPPAAPKG